MSHLRRLRLGAALAVAAGAAAVFTGTAGAELLFKETVIEEDTFTLNDFCDVPGLNVELDGVAEVRVQAVARGRDRLPYFSFHVRATTTYTNLANDKSVIEIQTVTDKDLRVTDNGDGTLTLLVLATGNLAVYEDGKAIARNPGQVRFELLIDHGGTPTDPSDDEEIDFLGIVKDSTGRTDDFCAAVVPALS